MGGFATESPYKSKVGHKRSSHGPHREDDGGWMTINGTVYYQADGAYFLPVMQNETIVYTMVQP